jgi:nucleoside-diphosphate-sugar epimerase
VVAVSRRSVPENTGGVSYVRCFGEQFGRLLQEHCVDVVVHCAHDVSAGGAAISERGTLQWATEAEDAGITRQIFVSSISARPDAFAAYGQVKFRLEQWFLERGGSIFRLGLVIGLGGLFARILNLVQKAPFVPLIESGRTRVYFNGIDFVTKQIGKEALQWQGSLQLNLQQPEPTTMREMLLGLRESLKTQTCFIPVPYLPCLALTWVLDRCGIRSLGITYENVVGLRQNDVPGLHSDFLAVGGKPEDVRMLMERAIRDQHSTRR